MYWLKILNGQNFRLNDEKKDGAEGGGAPDLAKEIADLKAQLAALAPKKDDPPKDKDLVDKAKDIQKNDSDKKSYEKNLQSALKFDLESQNFLKVNASLLPKDMPDIFKAANAENFESPIEKDQALKAGIIQSFFAVQQNLDLLTASQKNELETFLKLTKNSKQDKAQQIYDSIFEPTFENLKRIKKAEALRDGKGSDNYVQDAYKNRLIELSRKHYLGEKKNGT